MENFKQTTDWQWYEQLWGKKKKNKKTELDKVLATKCWLTLPIAVLNMLFAQERYPSCQIYHCGHSSTNLVGVLPA